MSDQDRKMNIARDEDCPQCQFPETYLVLDFDMPKEANPRTIGCRKCGWAYSPTTQILNPYTFDPIDFEGVVNTDDFSMAYILTAPELSDLDMPESWPDAVERRWREYAEHHAAYFSTAWSQGAEFAWSQTGEGHNGEYANGRTHDGAYSFEQLHPGHNPYGYFDESGQKTRRGPDHWAKPAATFELDEDGKIVGVEYDDREDDPAN